MRHHARLSALSSPGHRWRRGAPGDRGVTSLEMAILYPVLLLMILGMFQVSLYWHAANSAEVAAERGVDVGKVEFEGGEAAAEQAAVEAARQLLDASTQRNDPVITAEIAGDIITVSVETNAPRLVGPGQWRVRSEAQGRLERFVPADER